MDTTSPSPVRLFPPWAQPTAAPRISVVVTTCASGARLVRCIGSVLACGYDDVEVIAVENRPAGSTTSAFLGELFDGDPRVRYVEESRQGLSWARNAGLAAARGDVVVFTDDDVVVDARWLRTVVQAFRSPEVGCVTGLIAPLSLGTPAQALFERFAGFDKGLERRSWRLADRATENVLFPYTAGTFGSGANTAVRTSVLRDLGGFDTALGAGTTARGGEDLDLFIRLLQAGETIVYEPGAVVFHEHPADDRGVRRRAFDYGVGLTAMLAKQLARGPRRPLLRAIPAGVGYLLDPGSRKNASRGAAYPRSLTLLERVGMLVGPFLYVLSVLRAGRAAPPPPPLGGEFAPAAVRAIDLGLPLGDIDAGSAPDGRRYGSAMALLRLHGDPLAMVEVALDDGRIDARDLAKALWCAAAGEIADHVREHRCIDPPYLGPAALLHGLPAGARDCPPVLEAEIDLPFVSVIVPTAGRPERIARCAASLLAMCYPHFEVLFVDNAPGDGRTREIVETVGREDPRVRYIAEPLPGSSVARNRGVREATAAIVAFTDDDVAVDADWLGRMVEPFLRDERIGVVTGLVLPARLDTPDQRWFEEFSGFGKGFQARLYDLDEHRADDRLLYPYWGGVFGSGNSMAFRRSLLVKLGGFDPALGAGSPSLAGADVEAFSRAILAGSRLAYEPRAVCWHDHRASEAAVREQTYGYGVGFTAILTKAVLREPRLPWRMLVGVMRSPGRSSAEVPHELSRVGAQLRMVRRRNMLALQLRGYCLGPALYLRSIVWARRLRLRAVLPAERSDG